MRPSLTCPRSLACSHDHAKHPSRAVLPFPLLADGESRRTALPYASLARLTAHLGSTGKAPRTNVCKPTPLRAPKNRSTPELCGFRRADRLRTARPSKSQTPAGQRRRTTLRQSRPQVEDAFDDAPPASASFAHIAPLFQGAIGYASRARRLAPVLSTVAMLIEPTSDALCRAPRRARLSPSAKRETRTASTALASTRMAFPAQSAFHR